MVRVLDKKAFRELLAWKSQALTITLVIASGIAVFLTSLSAYDSLLISRNNFYAEYSLSQGFVSLHKAPESIILDISKIPGVSYAEGRIIKDIVLDFESESIPSGGRIVTLTEGLNRLAILQGRLPREKDETVISEAFSIANRLAPGSKLTAVLEGKKKILTVSGIALSPEYVYVFRPGGFLPDDKHYGILWMKKESVEEIFDMNGAVNDIVFDFAPNAEKNSVLKEIDLKLTTFGGLGSYDRDKLPSHSFLRDEFKQLRTTAFSIPMVFLGVAAFLLHIVSSRMISKQREQIATLKALGYGDRSIAFHYLLIILFICIIGSFLGIIFGYYLGTQMVDLYGDYYRFPDLKFLFEPKLAIQAVLIGIISGMAGSLLSIRKATSLQPAQAMRPPSPENFSKSFLEDYWKDLPVVYRIAIRNLIRRPGRTILFVLGVSSSVMIMVLGLFSRDTMNSIIKIQFEDLQRDTVTLNFQNAVASDSILELAKMEGILLVEGYRSVPIRIRYGNSSKEIALTGMPENSSLRRLIDEKGKNIPVPEDGILLNSGLAEKFGIRKGDKIRLEVLEGQRIKTEVEVTGIINEILGQGAYKEIRSLNRLLREGDQVNIAALWTDSSKEESLLNELKSYPKISGVSTRKRTLKIFYELMSRSILTTSLIIMIFACIISVGVVYNTALISLSERAFELGSLRILGFTKAEVFIILAGELTIVILTSLPLGCLLGYFSGYGILSTVETEGFKIPLFIAPKTYVISIFTVLITSLFSFWILYVKIKSMDLISVLKVRE
ncbi:ABC transporter permease [Leptospira sp. WS58.C1]|uniref:ABC transporter permease n=1 Tax=Leptospira TaxID=171 RepID=UPI0002BD6413|nr:MULTISPECIES: FtsX-like permease family protein [unclassified Leptospira]EMK00620.1 MacB-like periplasmic core domain protein [Leptospira sp. B5-022]MCR1793670.1 FtsX-like permease family protein [Leptospira sp. id769339]